MRFNKLMVRSASQDEQQASNTAAAYSHKGDGDSLSRTMHCLNLMKDSASPIPFRSYNGMLKSSLARPKKKTIGTTTARATKTLLSV